MYISAYETEDLEQLRLVIQQKLTGDTITFALPAGRGDLISLAYRCGKVIGQEIDGELLRLSIEVSKAQYDQHGKGLQPYIEQ